MTARLVEGRAVMACGAVKIEKALASYNPPNTIAVSCLSPYLASPAAISALP
ncbi:MAG TPA: hypothetical protein VF981_12665 [Gemmatimonadaceae bacterium]